MDSKNFFILFPDLSGLSGVPIFLDARLWEHIDDKKDLMAPVEKDENWDGWYEYKQEKFPNKLFFIVKAPKISFDYYPCRSGLIISQDFLDFIQKYTNEISFVPLEVYSNKMKIISVKKYYFLKFNSYLIDGFDYENSKYLPNISDKAEIIEMNAHPWISKVEKLILNEKIVNRENMFCLHGWIFFNKIFISRNVLEEALKNKFYGIRYVEVSRIVEFYKNRDNMKKGPIVVE